ncbi:MAG: hypothetical protein NZ959_12325 [Armatimonadetes bacterium]|nr:hypothetical protein [Armatimonadota bacterium]MDW8123085.1 hypothetical protein [Armatimonadota bacterium]
MASGASGMAVAESVAAQEELVEQVAQVEQGERVELVAPMERVVGLSFRHHPHPFNAVSLYLGPVP